jgi:hypothetical protein
MENLNKSLLAFQADCPILQKSSKVKVRTKSGGEYSYNYVDLPAINEVIMPILNKHGIIIRQPVTSGIDKVSVTTILVHVETGETLQDILEYSLIDIKMDMNALQNLGSIITYLRRYSICCSLNLVSDEDDDGQKILEKKTEIDKEITGKIQACKSMDCLKKIWEDNHALQSKTWFKEMVNGMKTNFKS